MKKFSVIVVVFVLCGLSLPLWAEEVKEQIKQGVAQQISPEISDETFIKKYANDTQWLVDKARLQKLGNNQASCSARWDILWPWARKGNLQARAILFLNLLPPPHGNIIFMPGSAGDVISQLRDAIIVAVHSVGYKDSDEDATLGLLNGFYLQLPSMGLPGAEEFTTCARNTQSHNCVQDAIKKHMVPTFEEFAAQIDFLVAHGKKAVCDPVLVFEADNPAANEEDRK